MISDISLQQNRLRSTYVFALESSHYSNTSVLSPTARKIVMASPLRSPSLADLVASTVIDQFEALPQKYKPLQPMDTRFHNWIHLAGIVLTGLASEAKPKCVALGTGMKCLPMHKVAVAKGNVLHDCHAEIVALRAFNLFLIQEGKSLLQAGISDVLDHAKNETEGDEERFKQPLVIKPAVKIHLYCSEAPCGDASMELVMSRQKDASPWPMPRDMSAIDGTSDLLGRGYFSEIGVVRRKPGM